MGSNFSAALNVETAAIANGLIVKKGSSDKGMVIAGNNERQIGVLRLTNPSESLAVGDNGAVVELGYTKVLLGGTLGVDADFNADAAGKAKALPTTSATKFFRTGIIKQAGVSGDLVECLITNDSVTAT